MPLEIRFMCNAVIMVPAHTALGTLTDECITVYFNQTMGRNTRLVVESVNILREYS